MSRSTHPHNEFIARDTPPQRENQRYFFNWASLWQAQLISCPGHLLGH